MAASFPTMPALLLAADRLSAAPAGGSPAIRLNTGQMMPFINLGAVKAGKRCNYFEVEEE
jgi:hypothetical protein